MVVSGAGVIRCLRRKFWIGNAEENSVVVGGDGVTGDVRKF